MYTAHRGEVPGTYPELLRNGPQCLVLLSFANSVPSAGCAPPGPPPCAKPQLPLGLSAGICAGGLSMDSVLDARARLNRCMLRRYARVSLHANRTPATLRNRGRRRRTSRALEAHYLPRAFSRRAATARRGGLGCGQTLERAGAHFRARHGPVESSPGPPPSVHSGDVVRGSAAGHRQHGIPAGQSRLPLRP